MTKDEALSKIALIVAGENADAEECRYFGEVSGDLEEVLAEVGVPLPKVEWDDTKDRWVPKT